MGNQLIQFKNSQDALPNLFRYYLYKRKVGVTMCLTGGQGQKTGAGKSYSAMRLAELTDKRFSIDDVCYTPKEFLERLDFIEASGKVGRCIVLDEGEIAVASRKWQQKTNETIGETIATFRYLRAMAIIVTPLFSFLDKNVRKLISYWGTTDLYNVGHRIGCRMKFYNLKTDIYGEKLYPKRLLFYDKLNERVVRGDSYDMGLISQPLIDGYEEKSREFKQAHRKRLLKETIMLDRMAGETMKIDLPAIAEELMAHPHINQILAQWGKVTPTSVMLIKNKLSASYCGHVSRMINDMAISRGMARVVDKIE